MNNGFVCAWGRFLYNIQLTSDDVREGVGRFFVCVRVRVNSGCWAPWCRRGVKGTVADGQPEGDAQDYRNCWPVLFQQQHKMDLHSNSQDCSMESMHTGVVCIHVCMPSLFSSICVRMR